MPAKPPDEWEDLPFRRPPESAPKGTIFRGRSRRVFVRAFAAGRSRELPFGGDDECRYSMSSIGIIERGDDPHVKVGDVMFGFGQKWGEGATDFWLPERILWLGGRAGMSVKRALS